MPQWVGQCPLRPSLMFRRSQRTDSAHTLDLSPNGKRHSVAMLAERYQGWAISIWPATGDRYRN
jgi:hypothetical protein